MSFEGTSPFLEAYCSILSYGIRFRFCFQLCATDVAAEGAPDGAMLACCAWANQCGYRGLPCFPGMLVKIQKPVQTPMCHPPATHPAHSFGALARSGSPPTCRLLSGKRPTCLNARTKRKVVWSFLLAIDRDPGIFSKWLGQSWTDPFVAMLIDPCSTRRKFKPCKLPSTSCHHLVVRCEKIKTLWH